MKLAFKAMGGGQEVHSHGLHCLVFSSEQEECRVQPCVHLVVCTIAELGFCIMLLQNAYSVNFCVMPAHMQVLAAS